MGQHVVTVARVRQRRAPEDTRGRGQVSRSPEPYHAALPSRPAGCGISSGSIIATDAIIQETGTGRWSGLGLPR